MIIGVLKEQTPENRVALLPEAISQITLLKATIVIEKGAGINGFSTDQEYKEAGA